MTTPIGPFETLDYTWEERTVSIYCVATFEDGFQEQASVCFIVPLNSIVNQRFDNVH